MNFEGRLFGSRDCLVMSQVIHELGASNWPKISTVLAGHPLLKEYKTFFTATNCPRIYHALMVTLDPKYAEDAEGLPLGVDKPKAPQNLSLAQKYYKIRVADLLKLINDHETDFRRLMQDVEDIQDKKWDDKLTEQFGAVRVSFLEDPVQIPGTEPNAESSGTNQSNTGNNGKLVEGSDKSNEVIDDDDDDDETPVVAEFADPQRRRSQSSSSPYQALVQVEQATNSNALAGPSSRVDTPVKHSNDAVQSQIRPGKRRRDSGKSIPSPKPAKRGRTARTPSARGATPRGKGRGDSIPAVTSKRPSPVAEQKRPEPVEKSLPPRKPKENPIIDLDSDSSLTSLEDEDETVPTYQNANRDISPDLLGSPVPHATSSVSPYKAPIPFVELPPARHYRAVDSGSPEETLAASPQPAELPSSQTVYAGSPSDDIPPDQSTSALQLVTHLTVPVQSVPDGSASKSVAPRPSSEAPRISLPLAPTSRSPIREHHASTPSNIAMETDPEASLIEAELNVEDNDNDAQSSFDSEIGPEPDSIRPIPKPREESPPHPQHAEENYQRLLNSLRHDVHRLAKHEIFAKPVFRAGTPQMADYNHFIYQPMDLWTIKERMEKGKIVTFADYERALILMVVNALMYNPKSSSIYRDIEQFFEGATRKINEYKQLFWHRGYVV